MCVSYEPSSRLDRGETYECNHHVRDIAVRNRRAVLVAAIHQVPNHIRLVNSPLRSIVATLLDDIHVKLGDLALGNITAPVTRRRQMREQEVHRVETVVQIVVDSGKASVKPITHLLPLERAAGRENRNLGDNLHHRRDTGGALEVLRFFKVVLDLLDDEGDVGFERFRGQPKLHKLRSALASILGTAKFGCCSLSSAPSDGGSGSRRQHPRRTRGW